MTADDAKKFAGVKQLAQSARAFADAVQQGFTNLKPGQQLSFNNTSVKVVEASPESVAIEVVAGVIRKFTPDSLPLGLKYGLVNAVIPPDDPANPLAKAAYHATNPSGDPAEVKHFLDQAQTAGADVEGILLAINRGDAPAASVAMNNEPTPGSDSSAMSNPEMANTPAPSDTPPSEPTPTAPPTAEELKQLTNLAQTARTALSERNLDEADELIAKAEALAKTEEHKEKIANLKQLAHYTREFWRAVDESLVGLATVGELQVGDNVVSIVESRPNLLVIKLAGQVRRYTRRDMPAGLARAAAKTWLNEGEAASLAAEGALYAVEKKGDPNRARELWQEAAQKGLDTSALLMTLDEDFDFTK